MLCNNRPEGFGPHSILSSPVPTSCFVDTILIPLPIWLALFFLPILFLLSIHRRKINFNPSTLYLRTRHLRPCIHTAAAIVYYVLIVCNILMQTLEIVRLSLIHFGIALLPFTYVGLMMAAGLHWSMGIQGRVRGWLAINGLIWLGGTVMSTVKVVGLVKMGINGRKGTKYPVSDQVIDVAVMAGVYAIIGILEATIAVGRSERGRDGEAESVRSGNLEHEQTWGGKK